MKDFITLQYKLYISGQTSIGLESIEKLANIFMTEEERADLFNKE